MALYKLPNTITERDLVEFDLFPVTDASAVETQIDLVNLEASELVLNFVLRQNAWSGYRYTNPKTQDIRIGYNTKSNTDGSGLTESTAYSDWIDAFKTAERKFKKLMPRTTLSQSQYDALLSLYFSTGSFTHVGTENRRFEILGYIRAGDWNYVGTALIMSGDNRPMRQGEAKILMLANYGKYTDRSLLKEQGLQNLRKAYPNGIQDVLGQQQAEYVYYAETGRFLPNMTQARKRQIVKLLS
jgi:hypothetical protein